MESNRGVGLRALFFEYKEQENVSMSDSEMLKISNWFYGSIKDTGLVLLKDNRIGIFPKTAGANFFRLSFG